MTITRRGALGAMIGGAVAGPEAAKQVAKTVSDGIALQNAPHPIDGWAAKQVGLSNEEIAKFRRFAAGDITFEEIERGWGYDGSLARREREANRRQTLRSVSPAYRLLMADAQARADTKAALVEDALERLKRWGVF